MSINNCVCPQYVINKQLCVSPICYTSLMRIRKFVSLLVLLTFGFQNLPLAQAQLVLPLPGQMVTLSPAFHPPVLKGLKVYPREPLRFDFILDPGQSGVPGAQSDPVLSGSRADLKQESEKLVKYFLAGLTIPEKDLWVNLSPYEKDRIIPEAFGRTEMGRDLLAQDYMLKQITASLLYPDGETGKKFWQKVYALAQEKYGTTDIPLDTFNKVWIVPEKAQVYENARAGAVYITDSRLKVMLEEDYLASALNSTTPDDLSVNGAQSIARAVLREVVIPVLEQEVNEGQNFDRLRQVYQSLILAVWYKKKIRQSLLSSAYVDRNKTAGINIDDPKEARQIWERYVEAFRKGAYDLVKEETDAVTHETLPRKYISGGWTGKVVLDFAQDISSLEPDKLVQVSVFCLFATDNDTIKPGSLNQPADAAEINIFSEVPEPEALVASFRQQLGVIRDNPELGTRLLRNATQRLYELEAGQAEEARAFDPTDVTGGKYRNHSRWMKEVLKSAQSVGGDALVRSYFRSFRFMSAEGVPVRIEVNPGANEFQYSRLAHFFTSQQDVAILLRVLSEMRLLHDFLSEEGVLPLVDARQRKAVYEIADGIYATAVSDSFRRYILQEENEAGDVVASIEIKIPGEYPNRYVLSEKNYRLTKELSAAFDATHVVVKPLFMLESEGEYFIYGKRVRFSSQFPLRVIGFAYNDGLRISEHFSRDPRGMISQAAAYAGMTVDAFKRTVVRETFKAVMAAHRLGYVGTHDPDGGDDIRSIVGGVYTRESIAAAGANAQELAGMGLLAEAPLSLQCYTLSERVYLKVRALALGTAQKGQLKGMLQEMMSESEADKVTDLLLKMYQRKIDYVKVATDMHLSNFKIVFGNDTTGKRVEVLSVGDSDAYWKPSDPGVFARIAGWEAELLVKYLKETGFALSDAEYGQLKQEASQSLDAAMVQKDQLGGIDLNAVESLLAAQDTASPVDYIIDPELLRQLNRAQGLVPVLNW